MRNHLLFLVIATILAFDACAQIQVSQEPRHHKVFENEWVRILDVHIPPHDTTLMHKHSTPSVFMVLSSTKTGSQVLVEPGKTSFANGNIWFESFKDTPRIHRVWNEDTVEFHVIDMELLHTPSPDSQQLSLPFSKDLFKADPVRAYRVTLPPGQGFALEYNTHPFVVVGLSGSTATGTVNGKHFTKKGDFLFLPAGAPGLSMSNKGSRSVQFAVFELF